MADDSEQIDILGDFDFKLEAETDIYDANELPSKSANLLPEYTNPPWMLEQGWTLDSCMDEKSKATIEKMLMEEQYYLNGKASTRSKPRRDLQGKGKPHATSPKEQLKLASLSKTSVPSGRDRPVSKRTWSEEEKKLFLKGLELHGRSWTKISELIPSRTSMQIKNFAHQYFKAQARKQEDNGAVSNMPTEVPTASSVDVISIISTAQTTVPVRETTMLNRSSHISLIHSKLKQTSPSKIKNSLNYSAHGQDLREVNTSVSETLDSDKDSRVSRLSTLSSLSVPQNLLDRLDSKMTLNPALIENLDKFCAVANIIAGETEESDEEDIDIENDDENEENQVLKSRSTSPNSVYEKLLKEANLKLMQASNFVNVSVGLPSVNGIGYSKEYKLTETKAGGKQETPLNDLEEENDTAVKDVTEPQSVETKSQTDCSGISMDTERCNSGIPVDDKQLLDGEEDKLVVKDTGSLQCKSTDSESSHSETKSLFEEKLSRERKQYFNAVLTCEGELVEFPVPTSEQVLQLDIISEEERKIHLEFFDSRPSSKTPERYLKIRNYIIETWKKCKPNYLNKTSVRPGLKNCGDVNCIGRIHAYLECTGVINFGCEQSCYNNPGRLMVPCQKEKAVKETGNELNVAKLEAMRPRKRRIRDAFGYWIDEKELEGKTIEHGHDLDRVSESGAETKASASRLPISLYDPFKLVPCHQFTEEYQAPFSVVICNSALMIMDMHSHISKTEVIGMLGGEFCQEQGKLTITMATPCNSISTGMQCEMDPVSQTQASEEISTSGMAVVGWYHSHPTFAPNPSIRDIETQLKFQNWFSQGGSNFVGVIVSPYNPANQDLRSEVTCLTVGEEWVPELQCNKPYKFDYQTKKCGVSELSKISETARSLASKYNAYTNRVDLTSIYRSALGISCLDKMLESLKQYYEDLEQCGIFESIHSAFSEDSISQLSESEVQDSSSVQ